MFDNCIDIKGECKNPKIVGSKFILTSYGYPFPKKSAHKPPTKNLIVKSMITITIVFILLCFCISQFVLFSNAAEPSITDEGSGTYTAMWTFDNENDFNTTDTIISGSEVNLKSYDYYWNQTSKKDFDKGILENVITTQKSITEVVISYDFEEGPEEWVHGKVTGNIDQWQYGNSTGIPEFIGFHDSGSFLWGTYLAGKYEDNDGVPKNYYLKSPNIDLSDYENIEMSFWHYYGFEDDINYNDGGIIEVSINGADWEQIDPKTGYIGTIKDPDNPLYDPINPTWCFAGNSSKWEVARFDLSKYKGNQSFFVRFRFATNGDVPDYGWYIDDIEITSTTTSEGEVELDVDIVEVGNPPANIIQRPANYTVVDVTNPVNANGILTKWSVHTATNGTGKMKIFREIGDEFVFVGETDLETIWRDEDNVFDCLIHVKVGDYIGWYSETAEIFANSVGYVSSYSMPGNISETFKKSLWSPIKYIFSISAEGLYRYPEGNFTSQIFDTGSSAIWKDIKWEENQTISDVDIVLQTRTGNSTNPEHSSWSSWSSPLTNPDLSTIKSPNARYIQFKAILKTNIQPDTPILFGVHISYTKYAPYGEVETRDFIPDVDNDLEPDIVVQWREFTVDENLRGQNIGYNYSLDSGGTWHSIPESHDLRSVSVHTGKIRFKVNLSVSSTPLTSTSDTTVSPTISEMRLTYSSAYPDMGLYVVTDKKSVKPGEVISYTIWYDNKGIGNATNVFIIFELDANLNYWQDSAPVRPTIEKEGNIIKYHLEKVLPGNRTFTLEAKVNDFEKETIISSRAILTYSDIGGNSYESIESEPIEIKATPIQDLFLYYLILAVIIAVILIFFILLLRRRIRTMKEHEGIALENVERGIGYLVMEENPSKSYKLFSDFIDSGYSGLCITRTFPQRVRSNYYFEGISILWLSRRGGTDSILPTNLGAVVSNIKDFMVANEKSVILLDGLEYLIVHNDFEKVLKLVHALDELTAINNSILIIPLNFQTLDEEKIALLKRELKILG